MEDMAPGSYAAVGMQPPPQPKEPPPRPAQRGAPLGQPQQQYEPPDAMYYEARAEGSQVMPWGDTLSRATGGRAPQVLPSQAHLGDGLFGGGGAERKTYEPRARGHEAASGYRPQSAPSGRDGSELRGAFAEPPPGYREAARRLITQREIGARSGEIEELDYHHEGPRRRRPVSASVRGRPVSAL